MIESPILKWSRKVTIIYPWINSLSSGSNSSSRNLSILLDMASTEVTETLILKSNLWTETETTSILLDSTPFWVKYLSFLHSLTYTTLCSSTSWNWWNHKQFMQKLKDLKSNNLKFMPKAISSQTKLFVVDYLLHEFLWDKNNVKQMHPISETKDSVNIINHFRTIQI